MTRTDTTVVGALVVLLALIAGLVGIPALDRDHGHALADRPLVRVGPRLP